MRAAIHDTENLLCTALRSLRSLFRKSQSAKWINLAHSGFAIAKPGIKCPPKKRKAMELAELGIKQILSQNLITAATILLIWYLTYLSEMAKWKRQKQDEAEERKAESLSGNVKPKSI
jgi:hypothetical protein